MSVISLKKAKKSNKKHKIVVSKKVKDYSNAAFVLKKSKAAESFLKKNGLPSVYTR
jgi:hypothetical protein